MKNPVRVLIVDDDIDICENVADILNDLGYVTDTACDGPSALIHVREHAYDIAVLDFKMPGMNGVCLYEQIRNTSPETVALLVSAFTAEGVLEQAIGVGMWKVLPKPLDVEQFLVLLDEITRKPLALVVDDDSDFADSVADILRERGFRVSVANTLDTAERRVQTRFWDVVLLDVMIGQTESSVVFESLRQADPDARVVVITGAADEHATCVENMRNAGAVAVHYKPLDLPKVIEALDRTV